MQKSYTRINWENYPSENTPLNETNLNRIDYATNEIDNRVIELDTSKANATELSRLIKNIGVDEQTGVITITYYNNTTSTIQTTLNKIAINFAYDFNTQRLLLTLNDGTVVPVSLADLIQINEFDDTSTVDFTVTNGRVSAIVPLGSIGDEHLRTDYLADIRVAEANAAASETNSDARALDSEAWAVGQRDGANVLDTDLTYNNNSKYYSQVAGTLKDTMVDIRDQAEYLLETVTNRLTGLNIMINYSDGHMYYDINSGIRLGVNYNTGQLQYEIVT